MRSSVLRQRANRFVGLALAIQKGRAIGGRLSQFGLAAGSLFSSNLRRIRTATDPDLANIFVPVRILRGIGSRIPTGYVYPCKEIKGISKSQLSLRFRQEKTGWVHSQADRGKSKSKLLSGIFSWERDWVWTPPEAVPNQNCLWNGNHTI